MTIYVKINIHNLSKNLLYNEDNIKINYNLILHIFFLLILFLIFFLKFF